MKLIKMNCLWFISLFVLPALLCMLNGKLIKKRHTNTAIFDFQNLKNHIISVVYLYSNIRGMILISIFVVIFLSYPSI